MLPHETQCGMFPCGNIVLPGGDRIAGHQRLAPRTPATPRAVIALVVREEERFLVRPRPVELSTRGCGVSVSRIYPGEKSPHGLPSPLKYPANAHSFSIRHSITRCRILLEAFTAFRPAGRSGRLMENNGRMNRRITLHRILNAVRDARDNNILLRSLIPGRRSNGHNIRRIHFIDSRTCRQSPYFRSGTKFRMRTSNFCPLVVLLQTGGIRHITLFSVHERAFCVCFTPQFSINVSELSGTISCCAGFRFRAQVPFCTPGTHHCLLGAAAIAHHVPSARALAAVRSSRAIISSRQAVHGEQGSTRREL